MDFSVREPQYLNDLSHEHLAVFKEESEEISARAQTRKKGVGPQNYVIQGINVQRSHSKGALPSGEKRERKDRPCSIALWVNA